MKHENAPVVTPLVELTPDTWVDPKHISYLQHAPARPAQELRAPVPAQLWIGVHETRLCLAHGDTAGPLFHHIRQKLGLTSK